MRRKPLNPDSAQAEGVDYLLREFKALRTATPSTTGAASTGKGGPIEPSYLVASADARDELRAVADFVCDGVNDEDEILAAVDALDVDATSHQWPATGLGKLVLTSGAYFCNGPVNMNGHELVGQGMLGTSLYFTDGAYAISTGGYMIKTGLYGSIRDLSIYGETSNAPTPPQIVDVGWMATLRNCYVQGDNETSGGVSMYVVRSSGNVLDCKLVNGPYLYSRDSATLRQIGSYNDYVIVSGNWIDPAYHADHGIVVVGDTMSVYGNQIWRCAEDGIHVTGSKNLINDNNIRDVLNYGIYLDATSDSNMVSGNIVVEGQNDGYPYNAIYVAAGATDNTVGPNLINDDHGNVTNPTTDLGTGTILVPDTTGVLAAVVKHDNFNQTGALTIGSGTVRYYTQTDRTITGVYAMVSGAPVTSPAVFDVNMDGATTIFTTQANRPEIAATEYLSAVEVPDVTAWDAGSYLLIDVDAANSATDLILVVQYTEA